MDNNRCFLDKVSDFEKLKYHAANCFDNCTKEKPYVIESVFGENPTEDERLAFAEVHNAHCRYNSVVFPRGPYLSSAPATQEEAEELAEKANGGDILSMLVVAWIMYVHQAYEDALKLFNSITQQGYSEGFLGLGWMHKCGEGVEKNLSKAVDYYEQAVLIDGNDEALLELGQYYEYEIKDREKALSLYLRSALQGNALSMFNVGRLYAYLGADSDSMKWYERSAGYKCIFAFPHVINHHLKAKNYDFALFWIKDYMQTNHPEAFIWMGYIYVNGLGVEKNLDKGVELLNKAESMAGENGDTLFLLAQVYKDIDQEKSMECCWEAARHREPTAEFIIASCLWDTDREQAIILIKDSASQGYESAISFMEEKGIV